MRYSENFAKPTMVSNTFSFFVKNSRPLTSCIGLIAGWRHDALVTAILTGFVLPTAAALALTNGNVGTLLRLRGTLIPYVVFLSATGFCAWLQRASARATPA